jgi:YD repeat-containing protein
VTDALGQVKTYSYARDDPNNVTATTFTYDTYARVRTFTDSEGWTVTYDYDAADRVTKVTYPDGTAETYSYDKLDLAAYQDRQYRVWTYSHDANRRLTAVVDPSGQQTQFAYDNDGRLASLTDPRSNVTSWTYDVQGRLTGKQFARRRQRGDDVVPVVRAGHLPGAERLQLGDPQLLRRGRVRTRYSSADPLLRHRPDRLGAAGVRHHKQRAGLWLRSVRPSVAGYGAADRLRLWRHVLQRR